jgi:hypothetical protein
VTSLPGTGGGTRLARLSEVAELGSPLPPKYEVRLMPGDCGVPRCGTGGAVVRMGKGVSTPDVSAEERLACMDISSSDSEPGPGESGTAAGGGGGTGRDSAAGARGVGLVLSLGKGGGAARSWFGGGGGTARSR